MLVLLPPPGLDGRAWDALKLPDLPIARHVYPGHGGRKPAADPFTMPSLADEVATECPGPLDVVGVALGGMVALHLALRHPDRVRSLLLAATLAAGNRDLMLRRAADVETHGMAAELDGTLERWFSPEARAMDRPHPGVEYARQTLLALDPGSLPNAFRAIADHDVRDRLGEIAAPTTCVAGADDHIAAPEKMQPLVDRIPNARMVVIPGRHLACLEHPDAFSKIVADHLQVVV